MLDGFDINFSGCTCKSTKEHGVYNGNTYNVHCHLCSIHGHDPGFRIEFKAFRRFGCVNNNYPVVLYPTCNVNGFKQCCILDNNIIRSVNLASKPDRIVANPRECLHRGTSTLYPKSGEGLAELSIFKSCNGKQLSRGNRTLASSTVYSDFLHLDSPF